MRIRSKGQVTIPAAIREQAGPLPDTNDPSDDQSVRTTPTSQRNDSSRGARIATHLLGRGDVDTSTDAIMALTRGE